MQFFLARSAVPPLPRAASRLEAHWLSPAALRSGGQRDGRKARRSCGLALHHLSVRGGPYHRSPPSQKNEEFMRPHRMETAFEFFLEQLFDSCSSQLKQLIWLFRSQLGVAASWQVLPQHVSLNEVTRGWPVVFLGPTCTPWISRCTLHQTMLRTHTVSIFLDDVSFVQTFLRDSDGGFFTGF